METIGVVAFVILVVIAAMAAAAQQNPRPHLGR